MPHEYSCGSCSFQVRSDDQQEVIDLVRTHANEKHGMDVSEQDVREGMQTV